MRKLIKPGLGMTFLIYLIFGLTLTLPFLSYPMVGDDLHLIRSFSADQLINSFHSSWDPDGIETPGVRPFTMLFNDMRYLLFGENVVLHHLFLTLLNAIFFGLFGWINHRFGIPWKFTVFAGLISYCARFNLQNIFWIADGVHAFGGIVLCVALICLMVYLDTSKLRYILFAYLLLTCSLLIREENLAAVPIIFLAGFLYWRMKKTTGIRPLLIFIGVSTLTCVVFYVYDRWVISDPSISSINFLSYFQAVFTTFIGFTGLQTFSLISQIIVYGWLAVYMVVLLLALLSREKHTLSMSVIYLVCMGVACLFAFKAFRTNLLLLPITLFAYHFVSLFMAIKNRFPIWKYVAPVLLVLIISGNLYLYSYASQIYNPDSIYVVIFQTKYVFNLNAMSIIPPERYDSASQYLSDHHINNQADFDSFYQASVHLKNRTPKNGELFYPILTPYGQYECNTYYKEIIRCPDCFYCTP